MFFNEDDNENGNDNENQKIKGTMNKENNIQNEELTMKQKLIYGAITTLAIIILMGVEGLLA